MQAFPYAHYRPGQREAIEQAQAAFERGKRFVVIEAPTGAGKSAMAVTLAREATDAYILTAQKVLQSQYVRDFRDLSEIRGRSNYVCNVDPHTHAAAAPCHIRHWHEACQQCHYFSTKERAMATPRTLMNYAYHLAERAYAGGFAPRQLLVLDEAHQIEAMLDNFLTVELSELELRRFGIVDAYPPAFVGEEAEYVDFAEDVYHRLRGQRRGLEHLPTQETMNAEFGARRSWLDGKITQLERLLESYDHTEWSVEFKHDARWSLVMKPITVAPFAEDVLFSSAERVLMLSATILDVPTFLRGVGLEPNDVEVIRVGSSFPPENRPLIARPVAKLTYHQRERDLPKLAAAVADIVAAHPNDKGIIHTHTYSIARYLAENLPASAQNRLITHTTGNREEALDDHLHNFLPTILLTPSMTEGVDFADDRARWQIICKLPYPYLGDPQIARRRERDPDWYGWRTCLSLVQTYGRTVRSAEDFAVTYVLDADFGRFVKRERKRLPEWFLEALTEPSAST